MNTKALFRYMVNDDEVMRRHRPVSVHVNYHPEKLQRMQDIHQKYHGVGPDLGSGAGKPSPRAIDGGLHAWHWGVGLVKGRWCREAPHRRPGDMGTSKLAQKLMAVTGQIKWAGITGLRFR